MRKFLAATLSFALVGVMAYGVVGSGAFFTASKTAQQTITVGHLTLEISSATVGSYFDGDKLVCPTVKVVTASGPNTTGMPALGCNIKIKSVGEIAPSQVNVIMSAVTDGIHLNRYGIFPTGFPTGPGHTEGAFFTLKTTDQTIGHFFGFEIPAAGAVIDAPVDWGLSVGNSELDNADMGTSVVVSYSIEAQQ